MTIDEISKPEEWRKVPGFDGWYEASTFGRLRSWRAVGVGMDERSETPSVLTTNLPPAGYYVAVLQHPVLGTKNVLVHTAVCVTFHGRRPKRFVCDHVNMDKTDNRSSNLEWVSSSENMARATSHGAIPMIRANAILTPEDVPKIRGMFDSGRPCREIAEIFGVSYGTIRCVGRRKSWKSVPEVAP